MLTLAHMENQKSDTPSSRGTVDMEAWLAANQPHLHPTRRRVLLAVVEASRDGQTVDSSLVRKRLGISQQLLNRHLRALAELGLLKLGHPGPGRPLTIQATPAGERAAGLRGPLRRLAAGAEGVLPETGTGSVPLAGGLDRLRQALKNLRPGLDQAALERLLMRLIERAGQAPAAPSEAPAPPAVGPAAEAPAAPAGPPRLSQAEAVLERRLEDTRHASLAGLPWHERTRRLLFTWDQLRKRRLGRLNSYFTGFQPLWQRADWDDFNLARRQADARGANYADWVNAQFERISPNSDREVRPADLHGEAAVEAYQKTLGEPVPAAARRHASAPPYTPQTFDPRNPGHLAHAEEVLDEMARLGQSVFGDPDQGAVRLLSQAVAAGSLPMALLDLRPAWREKVLAGLRFNHRSAALPTANGTRPGLII